MSEMIVGYRISHNESDDIRWRRENHLFPHSHVIWGADSALIVIKIDDEVLARIFV